MVADVEGVAQLIRVSGDTSTQLTHSGSNESPASAAGAIAFRSSSLGPTEILVADALGGSQRLAAHDTASNDEPSLSPAADSLVYANSKRGVPRLWITAVPPVGDTVRTSLPLMTGSDSTVPERAPAWSPTGGQIAFSSTRTGTSQIYTVGTGGGEALKATSELTGAFWPSWSADGRSIYYVTGGSPLALRRIDVAGGDPGDVFSDSSGVGRASCNATQCLMVTDPQGSGGDLILLTIAGDSSRSLVSRTRRERNPVFIR